MDRLHTIQQLLRRIDLTIKVNLADFYMHFLIGTAVRRCVRFMWEGRRYDRMRFGLSPSFETCHKNDGTIVGADLIFASSVGFSFDFDRP